MSYPFFRLSLLCVTFYFHYFSTSRVFTLFYLLLIRCKEEVYLCVWGSRYPLPWLTTEWLVEKVWSTRNLWIPCKRNYELRRHIYNTIKSKLLCLRLFNPVYVIGSSLHRLTLKSWSGWIEVSGTKGWRGFSIRIVKWDEGVHIRQLLLILVLNNEF